MSVMKLMTASWCSTCPAVKKFIEDNGYKQVSIIDVDEDPRVAMSAGIRSVPSLVVDGGDTIVTGVDNIKRFIANNYDSDSNS